MSSPDINGSTATRLRAAVSPGTGCGAGEFAAPVVSVVLVAAVVLVNAAALAVPAALASTSTSLLAGDGAAVGDVGDVGTIDLRTTGAAPLDTGAAGDEAD